MKLSGLRIVCRWYSFGRAVDFFIRLRIFPAPFYEGKTLTIIAFTAPGGSADLRVKRRCLY